MNYMEWTFDEKSPIYKQLAHRLKYGILSGRLLPGEDIPSIRSMADMLHLNVNTVARSYRLLNQAGLIYTHRNKNYTVTSDNDFVNQKRLQEVRLLCCNYIRAMSRLGFSQTPQGRQVVVYGLRMISPHIAHIRNVLLNISPVQQLRLIPKAVPYSIASFDLHFDIIKELNQSTPM